MLLLKKEVKKLKMLNSEKMIVSIQNQDLEHANKYFEKALKNDPEEVLLELGAYLESIGSQKTVKSMFQPSLLWLTYMIWKA